MSTRPIQKVIQRFKLEKNIVDELKNILGE